MFPNETPVRGGRWITATCLLFAVLASVGSAATLSDNLNAPTEYTELTFGSTWVAAGFGTDSGSYRLGTVTTLMQQDAAGALHLDLYANGQNQPTSLIGTLTSPSTYPTETIAPTVFGGSNLLLTPNTTYWLVMSAAGSGAFEWAYSTGHEGAGSGFQGTWGVSTDAGASWYTSDLQPMQMSVTAEPAGAAVPEPGPASLLLLALICCSAYFASGRSRAATFLRKDLN
jgi:hypothetical protein